MDMSLNSLNGVISGLCRTCLAKEIELFSVFELRSGSTTFDSIIASITGIQMVMVPVGLQCGGAVCPLTHRAKLDTPLATARGVSNLPNNINGEDGLPTTICNKCKEKALKAYDFKVHAQQSEDKLYTILKRGSQELLNNSTLCLQIGDKNVKAEDCSSDNHDDYADLDISLPFMVAGGTYEVEVVKNESEIEHSKENLKTEVLFENFSDNDSTYCPVCCQNFSDGNALTEHAWQSHSDIMGPRKRGRKKKLTSTILYKLTENGLNLNESQEPKHKCVFCIKVFHTKDDLSLHMSEHKDEKIFSCMVCKKMFIKKKDFERHTCLQRLRDFDTKEEQPPDTKKEERKHELYNEIRVQELLKKSIVEGIVSVCLCDCCQGLFASEAEMSRHRDREHPELSVRCHLCDKVFATLKSASRHRAVCERVERLFACASCEMRFTNEVTLNKHILRVHAGQSVSLHFLDKEKERGPQNYKCDVCGRPFTRKDLLERHSRSHRTGEKMFECDLCKKKFTRRENLRTHLRLHEGKTYYPDNSASLCLYCGRSFSNSSNFLVHMRRHTGEKPYKCDFCGKGFCRSSDLQCHRRSHTGEKPCVCRECGKAFSRSNKLTRHMRIHTGDKPYKCPYCEKAFAQSNDLTVHVRRHTGDKPYVCEICGGRFIQGTALHAHRRAHGHYPPTVSQTASEPASHVASQPPPLLFTIQNPTQTHSPTQI